MVSESARLLKKGRSRLLEMRLLSRTESLTLRAMIAFGLNLRAATCIYIGDFSVWPFPPDDWLMAIFAGYFDDSRSSRPLNITSVAGFVATVGGWRSFDSAWRAFLNRHGIEYLHLRELFAFRGQFEKFKGKNHPALIALLSDAVSVIQGPTVLADYRLLSFSSVVYVNHLARMRSRFGVALDDYALAVAACRYRVAQEYRGHEVETFFDNFDGCTKKLRQSEMYLESYPGGEECIEQVSATRANQAAKWLPGMQAADFAAWEVRHYFSEQYRQDRKHGAMRPRKSFKFLYDLTPDIIYRNIRLDYPQIAELAKRCDLSELLRYGTLGPP